MKTIFRLSIFLFILIFFTSCTTAPAPQLPANYFYKGSHIDIHSPNEKGWSQILKDQTQITFAKPGEKYNESYIARVIFFPMESKKVKNKSDFLSLIKNKILQDYNHERFDLIKSKIHSYNKRRYSCVLVDVLVKDKFSITRKGNKEALLLQIESLYCQDPKRLKYAAGFMVGYSYRGKEVPPTFHKKAKSFIEGVEFSSYK